MQFDNWLKIHKIRQNVAAKALGIDGGQLSKILAGERDPTLWQTWLIYDYTKGDVTPYDWIERIIRNKKNG